MAVAVPAVSVGSGVAVGVLVLGTGVAVSVGSGVAVGVLVLGTGVAVSVGSGLAVGVLVFGIGVAVAVGSGISVGAPTTDTAVAVAGTGCASHPTNAADISVKQKKTIANFRFALIYLFSRCLSSWARSVSMLRKTVRRQI